MTSSAIARRHSSLVLVLAFLSLPRLAAAQDVVGGKKEKIEIVWETLSTKNYVLRYKEVIAEETVERIGKELEDILAQYTKIFRFRPKEKLQVKFLDSLNTYEQEGGDPSHPGFYSPQTKFLVIKQMPFYDLVPTVYHEAFHQYLAYYLDHKVQVPTWFNEGMAMYFERMQRTNRPKDPPLDPSRIDFRALRQVKAALATRTHIPFEKLVGGSYEDFHKKDKESLSYKQSFSVIYFLMTSSRGRLPQAFMAELKKSGDVGAANEKLFGKENKRLPQIEQAWRSFVTKTEIPDKA